MGDAPLIPLEIGNNWVSDLVLKFIFPSSVVLLLGAFTFCRFLRLVASEKHQKFNGMKQFLQYRNRTLFLIK